MSLSTLRLKHSDRTTFRVADRDWRDPRSGEPTIARIGYWGSCGMSALGLTCICTKPPYPISSVATMPFFTKSTSCWMADASWAAKDPLGRTGLGLQSHNY